MRFIHIFLVFVICNSSLYGEENRFSVHKTQQVRENDSQEKKAEFYARKAKLDSALGLMDSAFVARKAFMDLNDSINNSKLFQRIGEMQTRFDVDKKNQEIKLLNKDKVLADEKMQKQTLVARIVTGALIVFSLLLVLLLRIVLAKRRANNILIKQKAELDEKRKQLALKNEKIGESIRYARKIQEAVLPPALFLPQEVKENFTLSSAKDTLSGDFYWRYRSEEDLFIAIVDCTGHGVPGAMMSMLGYDMLEYAVKEKGTREPQKILEEMNAYIIEKLFKNNTEGAKDGMDLTLCRLNLKTREILFSGAKNNLMVVSSGKFKEYEVDKYSIGYRKGMNYHQDRIILSSNDMVYLSTDGFPDQKGGPDGKKFGSSRFKALLTEVAGLSATLQCQRLEQELKAWKGGNGQRDDILVTGFRCV